jgi:hypothetical protein
MRMVENLRVALRCVPELPCSGVPSSRDILFIGPSKKSFNVSANFNLRRNGKMEDFGPDPRFRVGIAAFYSRRGREIT